MSIGRERLSRVLAQLIADSAEVREEGAEVICDLLQSLDPLELKIAVRVLAALAAVEDASGAREAQLHAVAEGLDSEFITKDDVMPILQMDPNALLGSETEYFTELSSKFD